MIPKKRVLSKRQKSIQQISKKIHWQYNAFSKQEMEKLPAFGYFLKNINKVSNVLSNKSCTIFNIRFSERALIAKQVLKATMMFIEPKKNIPVFTLD